MKRRGVQIEARPAAFEVSFRCVARPPGSSSRSNLLRTVQLRVGAGLRYQLLVTPLLAYPMLVDDDDPVRISDGGEAVGDHEDRKSTRLNSSHVAISYAVFC